MAMHVFLETIHYSVWILLIPLADRSKTWVSMSQAQDIFIHTDSSDIPEGLNITLVQPFRTQSNRFRLFETIGVKTTEPAQIASKILALHSTNTTIPSGVHQLSIFLQADSNNPESQFLFDYVTYS